MKNWHINKDDIIINSIVAETREIAEELYPGCEIIEDLGYMGPGWTKTAEGWRPSYPDDGQEWFWSEDDHCFLVVPEMPESEE